MNSWKNGFRGTSFTGVACGLFVSVFLLLHGEAAGATGVGKSIASKNEGVNGRKEPTLEMQSIAQLMVQLVVRQHYSNKPFDDTLSGQIFEEYLKRLDPQRMFFLKSDVARLSADRNKLAGRLLKGDTSFAFHCFNLMLTRLSAYRDYARVLLASNPELNTAETFEFDREELERPEDESSMRAIWRKKLLNDLIVLNLSDRAMAEAEKADETKKSAALEKPVQKAPADRLLKRIDQLLQYYQGLEPIEVLEFYLTTVAQIYDPHSQYMSPRTNENFDIDMSLSLVGIGAVLTSEDGYTKVVEIIPGGPADKEGSLKANDRITQVAQDNEAAVDVVDMPLDKVVQQIRGKEKTRVSLTVLPTGTNVPKKIVITRAKVELKDSGARGEIRDISGKKIGIISLPSFYMDFEAAKRGEDFRSASNDVRKLLLDFKKQGIAGLIMDLRSNGGGSLREAVLLTGLFIKDGPVVQVRDRYTTQQENDDDEELVYDGPLIVMVNKLSASSSEIFAAAIRDYNRGLIVGDRKTHGKGTVQFISDLDRYMPFHYGRRFPSGSIKLTNAKFYRINGESTQLKGVSSDIVFPAFTDVMDTGEDRLEHALPWDHITAVPFQPFAGRAALTDALRLALRSESEKRMAESREFQQLNGNIRDFKRIRDQKVLSLNLDHRWNEYLKEKKIQEEQKSLYDTASGSRAQAGSAAKKPRDLYLDETLRIMLDLIQKVS